MSISRGPDNINLITSLLGSRNECIDGIRRKTNHGNQRLTTPCDIASFLKKMKPETARKHFIDPFCYWHPMTNNDVQTWKELLVALLFESLFLVKVHRGVFGQILVASNQQNNRDYFTFRRVFLFFADCLRLERSHLTAHKLFYKWVFGSDFLFDWPKLSGVDLWMMRTIPLWENQVTLTMTWWHVWVGPYISAVLVYIWCWDFSIMKQQITTPCGKPIRYAWTTPHNFLEKFSKNLYGTTGGTYSSRFLRPVMAL